MGNAKSKRIQKHHVRESSEKNEKYQGLLIFFLDTSDHMTTMTGIWNKFIPGPIQHIRGDWGHENFSILRLDLIQSWADGNKYYKLKKNIAFAIENGIKTIVSKGGMFSNHLFSLAHACSIFGIELVCVVRSYAPDPDNPILNELKALSHEILFLKPESYQQFNEAESLIRYPGALFIPEGGMNERAISGAKEIMEECQEYKPSHIIIAGGTMGTSCGLLASASNSMKIIIVPAWKGCTNQYVEEILLTYNITPQCAWELWPDDHFGGFAKYNRTLSDFMYSFTKERSIPLDPVYTGKMMYAIAEKIKSGYFSNDDSILAIHTGGIQGVRGFSYRYPEDWRDYSRLIVG